MTIAQSMLPEYDEEMKITRRVLERVPSEKGEWKPHPKSFPLAHLAQLVSIMPAWLVPTLKAPHLDIGSGGAYSNETTETLLKIFDKSVRDGREALDSTSDEELAKPWSLKMGERVLFTAPRAVVARQTINHLVHHRGQLTVYLRLLDVPLPSIYGPTADEPW